MECILLVAIGIRVADCSEFSNKSIGSVKCGELIFQLRSCQLLKKHSDQQLVIQLVNQLVGFAVEENLIFGEYVVNMCNSTTSFAYQQFRRLKYYLFRSVERCCCVWRRYTSQLHAAGNVGFLSGSCVKCWLWFPDDSQRRTLLYEN